MKFLLLIFAIILAIDVWKNDLKTQPLFLLLYIFILAVYTGRRFFQDTNLINRIIFGSLYLMAILSTVGTLTYYFYEWNRITTSVFLLAIPLLIIFLQKKNDESEATSSFRVAYLTFSSTSPIRTLIIFILQLFLFLLIFRIHTTSALRSPWEFIPDNFFLLFGITSFLLIRHLLIDYNASSKILIMLHVGILVTLIANFFPLGFGFDPHIHITAMEHITKNGLLLPKTPYYIGAYIPIVSIAHIFDVKIIALLTRWILPIMTMFVIPTVTWYALRRFDYDRGAAALSTLTLFVIPFATFTVTTPQGIANLFAVSSIFFAFTWFSQKPISRHIPFLFAFAATTAHPITGIPTFLIIMLFMFFQRKQISIYYHLIYSFIAIIICAFAALILPLIFAYLSNTSITQLLFFIKTWNFPQIPWPTDFPRPFDPLLDLFYTYKFILPILIIFGVIFGAIFLFRQTKSLYTIYYPIFLLALFFSAGIIAQMQIPTIINYEKNIFAVRVVELTLLFSLPLFSIWSIKLYEHSRVFVNSRFYTTLIITIMLIASMYFSYPRVNHVETTHGYNVSQADYDGVRAIAGDAGKTQYITLANQAFSAAALREHGFTNYYKTEKGLQYFYPIPTGGPLYEFFLKMIYETPDKTTADSAMRFMNVNKLYFVVHNYWWNAEEIKKRARISATRSFIIDNKIEIFIFEK